MPNRADQIRELMNVSSILWIGLGVALIAMAVVVHRIRAWYRDGDDPADDQEEIVRQLHESKLRGELTDEEFRSIKSQIKNREER
ncbi:SHOCT domain-containing protein [Planctomicrobium piriforme]|uniref:Short C-terminal domain-containing protein n=1 Tax=Planctomicrobium piriforme TaxID=1576369 RepID=A0A1I3C467_9PLAN|nr:hypothetical protein [Planctomicrobium piriforme]SFH69398.1 hypothetical protein SAMN05421753_10298 [Planctomicrobium piriforme]